MGNVVGVQLVAASVVVAPETVWTVIVGCTPKPEVASVPTTVMVTGPPFAGFGLATTEKVGAVVSTTNWCVSLPWFPARSSAYAAIVATPSGPAATPYV